MPATILPFPSCGSRGEFRLALSPDQFRLPGGHVVEIIGLNGAAGGDVNTFQHVAARHLRVDGSLDTTNEPLINANPLGEPRLRSSVDLAPFRQLHATRPNQRQVQYVGASYFVNGHDDRAGPEYAAMAYIFAMHPGNRLRQVRKQAGLTQEQLAERTGFNQDRISNYENGRRPMRLVEMRVLARELGCSPADLLDDSDNPERLSEEERRLLEAFRSSPPAAQDFLLTSAVAVADRPEPARKVA